MKTLIIKLGAFGDVVRTTVLLRELEGEVFWLTRENAQDLLSSKKISRLFFFERQADLSQLLECFFDCIISLDEEKEVLEFVRNIKTKKLIGVFLNEEGKVDYSLEANYWFNMSLSSEFGKEEADRLKLANKKSFPQILVEMIDKEWIGQEYDLGIAPSSGEKNKIGLISISTSVWPNKNWGGWDKLYSLLKKEEYPSAHLLMKKTLLEHIREINACEIIICGDTLGMHLALALRKKVFVLFNCTPPQEICDYGRMIKILSPFLQKYMYKKTCDVEAQNAINPKTVLELIKKYAPLNNE